MADATFDLTILDSGDPTRAIAVARSQHDLAIEPLACAELQALMDFRQQLAKAAAGEGARPTEKALTEFGRRLFALAVHGRVRRVFERLPAQTHTRLQVFSDRADLQSLPWEFLVPQDALPGPHALRSVVRVVPTIGLEAPAPARLGADRKLRMLFAYAEPSDQSGVSWDDIHDTIDGEFAARVPERFRMDVVEGASPAALFAALEANDYDILHFAGHGRVTPNGVGQLLLLNRKTGKSAPLAAAELGALLAGKRSLRAVVLSACSSSAGDFAQEFAVVAKTLVEAGVPAVVANQFPITNSMAATFAGAFYAELLRSGDVDQATTKGRLLLYIEPSAGGAVPRFEWGVPTIYRHAGAARILAP